MKKLFSSLLLAFGVLLLLLTLGAAWGYAFGVLAMAAPGAFFAATPFTGVVSAFIGGVMWNAKDPWPWFIQHRLLERRVSQQEYLKALQERQRVLQRAGLDFTP